MKAGIKVEVRVLAGIRIRVRVRVWIRIRVWVREHACSGVESSLCIERHEVWV